MSASPRRIAGVLALAAALVAPAWSQPAASTTDTLTDLVVQALPMGEVLQYFVDKDPRWPLADKVSRVAPGQFQCLRHRLSIAGYRESRRDEVATWIQRNPERVEDSIRLLRAGASDMAGASTRLGLDEIRTGRKADYGNLPSQFAPLQLAAFVELSSDDKYRSLRDLIGLNDFDLGGERSQEERSNRGQPRGRVIGMKLMLAAMDYCKVPLAAVQ